MLWLCLHLPRLPAEVFSRGGTVREPFVVAEGTGTRELVVTPSAAAAGAGVFPGTALSAAHALVPSLSVLRRDKASEAGALARLAAWAGRFTPAVSLAPPREVVLDVAGSLKLFRGMDNLVDKVEEGIRDLGYTAQVALAPTPLGAALLARARPGARVTGMERLAPELLSVPLDALDPARISHQASAAAADTGMSTSLRSVGHPRRSVNYASGALGRAPRIHARLHRLATNPGEKCGLAPETLEALRDLGLATLGDCLALPRPGLARRFGEELPRYLDRALGRLPDPRNPFAPPHRFEGRLPLVAEASAAEPLLFAARRLLLELEGYLEARGGGAGELRLTLFHREGRRTRIEMGLLSPSRDPGRLLALLRERLARTRIPEPVSAVGLSVETVLPLAPANRELFRKPAQQAREAWPELVERLRARLGLAAVQGLRPAADHRPERAFVRTDPGHGEEPAPPLCPVSRPLWLLPRPAPLERKELTLLAGPERIETGWWDGEDVRRDYFVAVDPRGARLWVFRERSGKRQWYLHGVFG